MSNKFNLEESLSALMDDEVDDLELRRVLKELPENAELHQTWSRYHLISASLKQEAHSKHSVDILTSIHSQIASEPILASKNGFSMQSVRQYEFMKTLGQGAIAATVALAVLFTVGSITDTNNSSSTNIELATNQDQSPSNITPVFNGNYTASEFSRVASFDGTVEDKAKDRLSQAVYRELEELPEAVETQVADRPIND